MSASRDRDVVIFCRDETLGRLETETTSLLVQQTGQNKIMVAHKNRATASQKCVIMILHLTLPNAYRFLKLFHRELSSNFIKKSSLNIPSNLTRIAILLRKIFNNIFEQQRPIARFFRHLVLI